MFDKFGEFDSAEELNRAALAQREEGDKEALKLLAAENGIDVEDAEDFINGWADELVSPVMAALGKLDVECVEYKIEGVLKGWVEEIRINCMSDEAFARAVRRKGKDLAGFMAQAIEQGCERRITVDDRIVKKAPKVKAVMGQHPLTMGVLNKAETKQLIKDYYMGGSK
ncbi:MAG: hypothetical protein K2N01_12855 [Lachnospiraceae bacterium]|nr:hypothetical protein [Lachnospiraceae bacterium]